MHGTIMTFQICVIRFKRDKNYLRHNKYLITSPMTCILLSLMTALDESPRRGSSGWLEGCPSLLDWDRPAADWGPRVAMDILVGCWAGRESWQLLQCEGALNPCKLLWKWSPLCCAGDVTLLTCMWPVYIMRSIKFLKIVQARPVFAFNALPWQPEGSQGSSERVGASDWPFVWNVLSSLSGKKKN